ncbi:Uncharacterised protein [Vibrio cholerae]|nr:Uncharacterised protein [Vibrio cholerae]
MLKNCRINQMMGWPLTAAGNRRMQSDHIRLFK